MKLGTDSRRRVKNGEEYLMEKKYDVIIIGGGPAGLTAGIYTAREMLSTLILEKLTCGGWPNISGKIENYPGFPGGIQGMELSARFKEQAEGFGVEIREFEPALKVSPGPESIGVETEKDGYSASSLIIAAGSRLRQLGVPGERQLTGKGVSYCATCDGPLFRDQAVAVVGGGNAALEEALFLTGFVSRLYLIHRRREFRGEKILVEELKKNPKVELVLDSSPVSINGDDAVTSITVEDVSTGRRRDIELAGVFIFVGVEPNSGFLSDVVELDGGGHVKTDLRMGTSRPGIFASGDIRAENVRQVAAACGEGTVAALSVRDHLRKLKGSAYGR